MDATIPPVPPWTAIGAAEERRIVAALDLRLQCLQNPFVDGVASATVVLPEELAAVRATGAPDPSVDAEIERRIIAAVNEANAQFLRADVRYVEPYAERRRMRLVDGGTVPGLTGADSTRKLVLVLPLGPDREDDDESSDTSTNEVVFDAAGKTRPVTPGELLLFPAFMVPRFSLPGRALDAAVLYAHGPAFR